MEALVSKHIVYCWDLGLLDANGVIFLLRILRDSSYADSTPRDLPRHAAVAHRLLREAEQNTESNFELDEAPDRMDTQDSTVEQWMTQERKRCTQNRSAQKVADEGWDKADSWMTDMVRNDPVEPPDCGLRL